MAVPYTFGTATASVPLSQLDSNFATAITLGNTAVYLGNTTTSIGNLTLTNVTVSSVSTTFPNSFLANSSVTIGSTSVALGATSTTLDSVNIGATTAGTGAFTTLSASSTTTLSGGTANGVAYLNGSKQVTTGTALTFDGTNLGLGVTPSAWWSAYKVLEMGALGNSIGAVNAGSQIQVSANAYQYGPGTYKYGQTGYAASLYSQSNGSHSWSYAPSGTAGTAITFTQAMTLDASGNLLVGETAAGYSLSGRGLIEVNGSASSLYAFRVGSASKGYLLHEGTNLYISNDVSGSLILATNATERARIDSSGNLLVGSTSTTIPTGTGSLIYLQSPGAAYVSHANGASSGTFYCGFAYNGSVIGSITQSGTTAVLYNVTSDQRLKENIVDAAPASNLIDSLQVRQFDWKTDNTHQRYGFVAQELVTVAPEAVHQPADPEEMMAVDYSKLVPMLVKEIQDLRKRLAAAGI